MKVVVTLSSRDYDAVLLDLDGVLTRTARVHAAAWKRLFDGVLEQKRLDLRIHYRGHSLDLRLTRGSLTIRGRDGAVPPITLCVDGEVCDSASGTTRVFRLNDDATDRGTHRDVPGAAQ